MAHSDHGPVDDPNFVNDKPYETREVFTMGIVYKSLLGLGVFIVLVSGLTWAIFRLMVPTNSERTTAFPMPQERVLPREPRLQANPTLEISDFRAQENEALTSYGRDPKTGNLHIPVDRAIDVVLQEGLPTRPNPGKINLQEPTSHRTRKVKPLRARQPTCLNSGGCRTMLLHRAAKPPEWARDQSRRLPAMWAHRKHRQTLIRQTAGNQRRQAGLRASHSIFRSVALQRQHSVTPLVGVDRRELDGRNRLRSDGRGHRGRT